MQSLNTKFIRIETNSLLIPDKFKSPSRLVKGHFYHFYFQLVELVEWLMYTLANQHSAFAQEVPL